MKKKQFGILLTISLSKEMYELIKTLSDQYQVSMGEVVRDSIELLSQYDSDWLTCKPSPAIRDKKPSSIDMSGYTELIDMEVNDNGK